MPQSTPATSGLTLAFDGPIATLTMVNPARRNAMTAAMWGALPALVGQASANPEVRVLILRGAGTESFCAGADISEFATARAGDAVHTYDALNHAAFEALTACPKPTIAMIHGFCMGGGLGLALACDLRMSSESGQFALPPAKLGIGYNPRWIGPILRTISPASAKLILFTGRRFNADDALAMGLITEIVPGEILEPITLALANEIAANAPLSVACAKATIDEYWQPSAPADAAKIDRLVKACFESEDYAEGRNAFLDKRKPHFNGR